MLNWKVKRYDNHPSNPIDRWEAKQKAVWEPGDVERVHIIQAQYSDMERSELGTYESDPKAKPEFYIVLCRLQGYSGEGKWFVGPEIFRRVFRTLREAKKYVNDKFGSKKPTCSAGKKISKNGARHGGYKT
jgi:hypothetical protein